MVIKTPAAPMWLTTLSATNAVPLMWWPTSAIVLMLIHINNELILIMNYYLSINSYYHYGSIMRIINRYWWIEK